MLTMSKYYAACNASHDAFGNKWYGPDRTSRSDAQSDADDHKEDNPTHSVGVLGPFLAEEKTEKELYQEKTS